MEYYRVSTGRTENSYFFFGKRNAGDLDSKAVLYWNVQETRGRRVHLAWDRQQLEFGNETLKPVRCT